MASTWRSAVALSLASVFTLVAGQGQVVPPICHKGIQVITVPGTGVANGTYGLSTDLAYRLAGAIPDSSTMTWDYDRFPPNGDIGDYFTIEVQNAVAQLYTAFKNYVTACPNTPIVLHGYSEGAAVVGNLICGCNWGGVWNNGPLDSSFASHIVGVILYGDEMHSAGQPYNLGGCTVSAPYLARTNNAGCSAFVPVMQNYCLPNDDDCCATANPNYPTPDGNPWHWQYPAFDVSVTAFVINRYNNYIAGIPQTSLGVPASPSNVGAFKYQGCYTDSGSSRALSFSSQSLANMSLEQCAQFCSGHLMFGTEYTDECYCGDYLSAGTAVAPTGDCNMPCEGSLTELCGGPNRINLYAVPGANLTPGATTTIASTTSTAPKTSTLIATSTTLATVITKTSAIATPTSTGNGVVTGSLPAGIVALGCYVDSSARALPVQLYSGNNSNSDSTCALACRALGYPFSGTEFGGECYCGYSAPATPASSSDCNMACPANAAQVCGAGWRLSVAQDTTLLSNADLVSGIAQMGCFQDSSTRTFPIRIYTSSGNTDTMCSNACLEEGFPYSGTEYGQECWCGYSLPSASLAAPPTDCNMGCPGDGSQPCGAGWRLSVQQNTNVKSPIVNPGTNGMSLLGCYTDSSTRTLPNQVASTSGNTISSCISACKTAGYAYCGMEFGQECWGGSTAPSSSLLTAGPSGDMIGAGGCGQSCSGNSSEVCGAGWRLIIYH